MVLRYKVKIIIYEKRKYSSKPYYILVVSMVGIPFKIGRIGKIGLGVLVAGIAVLVYYYLREGSALMQLDILSISGIAAVCAGIALMVLDRGKVKVEQTR
jgi:hypothetical protein